jgi:pseudaminic acid synthase
MLKIKKNKISLKNKPVLISEISGNHNGKLDLAIKLVRKAAKYGSDLIKLQTYEANDLTLNSSRPEFYVNDKKSLWKKNNLFKLYTKGSTLKEWHYKLFEEAKKYKVECFTSIFDENDIEFLENLKVPAYKIASFECLHFPLIDKVIKTKKPILISTGLCTLNEIKELVNFLKKKNCKNFSLLKCTSSYPAISDDLNLTTIGDMRKKFKCEIGYSDHSIGFNAAIGAIHQGASFIEKHVCLNKKIGIDSKFSLEVENIPKLKNAINEAYLSAGKISYGPSKNELPNLQFRRSIYASNDIKKGERFSKLNIKVIRPGFGLEPKYYRYILGKKSLVNLKFATPLKWKYIKS